MHAVQVSEHSKMNTENVNLNEIYFEYKVLPEIIGTPKFNALRKMIKKLKTNTASVTSTLVGGDNG